MKNYLFLLIFLFLAVGLCAQDLTAYWNLNFNGNCSFTEGPVEGTRIERVSPAPIPTISYSSLGARSTNWNVPSLDEGRYYQYTLTASAHANLLCFYLTMRASNTLMHSAIRVSEDGFATYRTLMADYSFSGTNPYQFYTPALSIPMENNDTVTIRVYAWGATAASDLFYNKLLYICGNTNPTLPVELSSFTANLTYDGNISLNWMTQSENDVLGYHVFRNTENLISTANCLTQALIPATNTSTTHTYSCIDDEVGLQHVVYYYWLQYTEFSGETVLNGPVTIEVNNTGGPDTVVPDITSIQAIYPNPFFETSSIKYGITKTENVSICIYNIKGQLVTKLDSGVKEAGTYDLVWNGRDLRGDKCASGIYYVMLNTGSSQTLRKMVKF